MTIDDFTRASIALLRSAVGWKSAIARRLGVEPRQVRRWLEAGEAPAWVAARFDELSGGMAPGPWPRDEWIVGRGPAGERYYVVHALPPRFVARIVMCGEDGSPLAEDQPADTVSGMVYVADGMDPAEQQVLCEIDWIEPAAPGEAAKWMEAAADAVEQAEDGRE